MIDILKLPEEVQEILDQKYLEYPPNNKEVIGVLQRHVIGKSAHFDFRFPVNDHLNGWAIVGFNVDDPPTVDKLVPGKGFRAEPKCPGSECNDWRFDIWEEDGTYYFKSKRTEELSLVELARQPKIWLFEKHPVGHTVHFKPGTVGAGVDVPGEMTILARPRIILGSQKPFYHEYYWKGFGPFKDWTKVTIRRVSGRSLEPETKAPGTKKVLLWKFMVNKNQMPYAISNRAMEKGWKPPKNIIPFPVEWTKKNFPEQYQKWLKYMKSSEESSTLSNVRFTLSLVSWMGPPHIRKTPRFKWLLFIDDKKGKLRTFRIDGSPLRGNILGVEELERSSKKWLDYEGPLSHENPWVETRKLEGHMIILDKGTVSYDVEKKNKRELIRLNFKGKKLKGKWSVYQDEEGTSFYTMTKLSEVELEQFEYVFHEHQLVGFKPHWDIRIRTEPGQLFEINLWDDIRKEKRSTALPKICDDMSWFIKEGKKREKMVGNIKSYVTPLDYGKVNIIENTPRFKSFEFHSEKNGLKGLYVLVKEDGKYYFEKESLPGEKRSEELDFNIEQKKGWNYFIVKVHDMRKYSRCESPDMAKEYLKIDIPEGIEVYICLFYRPGKIHGAEVGEVKFYTDKWTKEDAISWIKKNNLDSWEGEQIRKRRE